MIKLLIKNFCWLHNFSYKIISALVVRDNNGIHPKHRILNYHKFFTDNLLTTDNVLDIGCGNGAVTFDISQKSKSITGIDTGIDIIKENIILAKKNFSNNNLHYILGDATTYSFNNTFDVIVLSNVLEHIENRIKFLSKIKKLLQKFLFAFHSLLATGFLFTKKKLEWNIDLIKLISLNILKKNLSKKLNQLD